MYCSVIATILSLFSFSIAIILSITTVSDFSSVTLALIPSKLVCSAANELVVFASFIFVDGLDIISATILSARSCDVAISFIASANGCKLIGSFLIVTL